ncbi:IS6 family transposase [Endozoicomonas sp.]|uniref:IS6 family transposase n=1 Tax=Endozoicomonas sp. TaxID=1892382 RepID=UPI00383B6D53
MDPEMDFSGRHFPKDVILQAVRWYLRFCLSYRDLKEILEERGIQLDHTTLYRWVQKYAPQLEAEHRKRRKVSGTSWRMDETYIKVKGEWTYLYRAVDTQGQTVDFLLTKKRDQKAALRFFRKTIRLNGMPDKVTIDKSGSNTAALDELNQEQVKAGKPKIEVRQIKYLNNLVEQDHRGVKRRTRPMLGFQSFKTARRALKGVELCHMIRKGQYDKTQSASDWDYFYSPEG